MTFIVPFDDDAVELAGLFSEHEASRPTDRPVSNNNIRTDDIRRMV